MLSTLDDRSLISTGMILLDSIADEFSKIVQEDLEDHLKKVGLPDVRTLLVQSRDLIFMKITNNGGIVYVYVSII